MVSQQVQHGSLLPPKHVNQTATRAETLLLLLLLPPKP
jgi:hypothetical protein